MNATQLSELIQKRAELDAAIAHMMRENRQTALDSIKTLMLENDLGISDIAAHLKHRSVGMPGATSSTKGVKIQARYRNPETGDTWAGRGMRPAWLKVALESGRQLSEFDVELQQSLPLAASEEKSQDAIAAADTVAEIDPILQALGETGTEESSTDLAAVVAEITSTRGSKRHAKHA